MVLERRDALADEQAVAVGDHTNEPRTAAGEIEYLGGTRVEYELLDVFAHQLLGADTDVDRNRGL